MNYYDASRYLDLALDLASASTNPVTRDRHYDQQRGFLCVQF